MLNRKVLALACLGWLVTAGPAAADVSATLTLRSGERISGDLIDLGGVGFTIRVNGQERRVPQNDVAVIEFNDAGQLSSGNQSKISAGHQFVIMRSGEAIDGHLVDIGGTAPLRLTIQTSSGTRDVTSSDVARVYLTRPADVAASQPAPAAVATTGSDGSRTVTVPGNQEWTSTGMQVRAGEMVNVRSSGEIRLSPNDDWTQAGGAGRQLMGPNAPMPQVPKGALLGRIDNEQPFLIGDRPAVRMPAGGTLYLGFNDDMVSDNSGSLQVTVYSGPARRR